MPGTASITVPIVTHDGETVAALSVAWMGERHATAEFPGLTAELQRAAHAIADRLSTGPAR